MDCRLDLHATHYTYAHNTPSTGQRRLAPYHYAPPPPGSHRVATGAAYDLTSRAADTKGRCASAWSMVRILCRLRLSYHHLTPHPAPPPSSTSGACSRSTPHHGRPCLVSGGACWPQS